MAVKRKNGKRKQNRGKKNRREREREGKRWQQMEGRAQTRFVLTRGIEAERGQWQPRKRKNYRLGRNETERS